MATGAAARARRAQAAPSDEEPELRRSPTLADASPPWLISLVVHLALLLILALFVTPAGEGLGRVLLTIGQSEGDTPGELGEFTIEQNSELLEPSESLELNELVDIDALELSEVMTESTLPELAAVDEGLGRELLPVAPMVSGRSGAMRKTLLGLYGGTGETENAVQLGLKWLSRQQRSDGSWSLTGPYDAGGSNENKPAATAMALLAFLGDGHTHQSGDYQAVVDKGIRWLVRQQDRDGFFAKDGRSHQQSYAQAQCSMAVCELYAMTEDSWLREPAQLALQYAERAQAAKGGWRYQPGEAGDTSVTGWYVLALQSGMAGGLQVDQSTLYKVRDFLDTVQHDQGSAYGYQPFGPPSVAMSAEGLLCRQYLGWPRDEPALVRGVTRLVEEALFDRSDPNFYYWYYATQVMHHYGGGPWRSWNEKMSVELPAMQTSSGREAGSWAPQRDRWGSSGGRLYSTCFAIYCLEVYYRHMPLYRAIEGGSG